MIRHIYRDKWNSRKKWNNWNSSNNSGNMCSEWRSGEGALRGG